MKTEERPTPETDDKQVHVWDANQLYNTGHERWRVVVPIDFARNIERQRDALREALEELEEDISERFDIESPSTNPGMRNCVKRSREILTATKPQE